MEKINPSEAILLINQINYLPSVKLQDSLLYTQEPTLVLA